MQSVIGLLVLIGSVLAPQRQWMAPQAPVMVNVQSEEPVKLMLTDFTGRIISAENPELARLSSTQSVDVRQIFPDVLSRPGTYVLWMVPPAAEDVSQFGSTPLVIEVRRDTRPGAPEGPMVIHVSPLSLVSMQTNFGPMEMVFYYDVAPNTVANFLTLVNQGFYDGLTFHRVIKGFVIQGGDPRGDGSGSPGYTIPAEFNDRPHHEGVLSMARQVIPTSVPAPCRDPNMLTRPAASFSSVWITPKRAISTAATPPSGRSPPEWTAYIKSRTRRFRPAARNNLSSSNRPRSYPSRRITTPMSS